MSRSPRVSSPAFNVTSVKVQWPHREWLSSLKADDFTTFNFPSRLSSFSSSSSPSTLSSLSPLSTHIHHTSLLNDIPSLFEDVTSSSSATSSQPIVEASSLWIAIGFSIAAVVLVLLLGGFFLVRYYKKKRLSP